MAFSTNETAPRAVRGAVLILKFLPAAAEELVKGADTGHLGPAAGLHRVLVQVIDLRPPQGQQEGGMGGDDELTAVKAGGVLQKAGQLQLELGRQTVFRLVQ